MSFKESPSFRGEITDIRPSSQLGVKGKFPIAFLRIERSGQTGQVWYPLENNHCFKTGDEVLITPATRYHESGGSLTVYRLEPAQTEIKL